MKPRTNTIINFARRAAMLLLAVFTVFTATAQTTSFPTASGGLGTAESPFNIATTADLDALASDVNSGTYYEGYYFCLTADISYAHTTAWDDAESTENNYTAIAGGTSSDSRYFKGTLDGQNHTVSGIRIYFPASAYSKYADCQGLIGRNMGYVRNIRLADTRITAEDEVGGIVGRSSWGAVSNCHVESTVAIHTVESEKRYHGGIVGKNYSGSEISNCTSAVTLTLAPDVRNCWNFGGIAGTAGGKLSNNLVVGATIPAVNTYGAIASSGGATLTNNSYYHCTVAGVANATGVGYNGSDSQGGAAPITGNYNLLVEDMTQATATLTNWDAFASDVSGGNPYSGKTVSLFGDISITSTVGTTNHPFSGTFNGNGYTLTANITDESTTGTAPFREISDGAVIRNLTVEGTVTGTTHTAGLVGFARGGTSDHPNTIEGCTVNASVSVPATSGNCHIGGVVGHGVTSYLKIKNTMFGGTMTNSGSYAGGLQGWSDGNTLTIENSFFKGSYLGSGSFHPIAIHNGGSKTTYTGLGAYYTAVPTLTDASFIAGAGIRAYATAPEDEITRQATLGDGLDYYLSCTVSGLQDCYFLGDGTPAAIGYTVTDFHGDVLEEGTHYRTAIQKGGVTVSSVTAPGRYTLTVTGISPLTGVTTKSFIVAAPLPTDADGASLIGSLEDWEIFASYVTNGKDTYSGKTVKLTADIGITSQPVTMMAGAEGHPFCGKFDGQGHTMTVSLSGSGEGTALFYELNGAVVQFLKVCGTVATTGVRPATIASFVTGTTTLRSCWSNATVAVDSYGGAHAGGMVACVNNGATVNLSSCGFAGSIEYGRKNYELGGMVGWTQTGATANLADCLFAPTNITLRYITSVPNYVFVSGNVRGKLRNCYNACHFNLLREEGLSTDGMSTSDLVAALNGWEIVDERPMPIMNPNSAASFTVSGVQEVYWLGSSPQLGLTYSVTDANGREVKKGSHFTEVIKRDGVTVSAITTPGSYTLTLEGVAPYAGSYTVMFSVYGLLTDGSGAYLIGSAFDWYSFAYSVNNGLESYSGKTVKLTADIGTDSQLTSDAGTSDDPPRWEVGSPQNPAVTVGTADHPFCGTLDGQNHTMNININDRNQMGTALFREIGGGAVIRNLTLTGAVTGTTHTGGLVGYSRGGTSDHPNTIDGCVVNVIMNVNIYKGNNHLGGIVGHGTTSHLKIRNTVFCGVIYNLPSPAGGLQGWSDGNTLTIENSLFAGSYMGSGNFHPIALQSSGCTTTYTNLGAYYTEQGFNVDASNVAGTGTPVHASAPEDKLCAPKRFSDGKDYYIDCTVSGMAPFYWWTDGTPVAVSYSVATLEGTPLVRGTNYTATLNGSSVTGLQTLSINRKGEHALTLTGIAPCTGSQTFYFIVDDTPAVTAATTTFEDGYTYKLWRDVTVSERIEVNGTVTLVLGEGATLTASKGIHVPGNAIFTIEGPGTLTATGENVHAGIGADDGASQSSRYAEFGKIIINGGNINAKGGNSGAGIGGARNNKSVDGFNTIIINGGVVHAQGGNSCAGIGGGSSTYLNPANLGYGAPGTIIINGGQVTANGKNASGIGTGEKGATTGSITLGWSQKTDFIAASSFNAATISFAEGKAFVIEETHEPALVTNIVNGCKLVPKLTEMDNDLTYSLVSNVSDNYDYTGSTISVTPIVSDVNGNKLTKGTDYSATLKLDGNPVGEVNAVGTYTYTFAGTGNYSGERSYSFTVSVHQPEGLRQTAYDTNTATLAWDDCGVSDWKLEYGPTADFAGSTEVSISDTPVFTVEGLNPDQTYFARFKNVVGTEESDWSSVLTFYPTDKTWVGFGSESTHSNLPTNTLYSYSITEQIYTPDQLGKAGAIKSISICMASTSNANYSSLTRNIDVYMVHTDKTSLTTGEKENWVLVVTNYKVFSGSVTFKSGEWTTINFSKPFEYDGKRNVALVVDDNTGSYIATGRFRSIRDGSTAIVHTSLNQNYWPSDRPNSPVTTGKTQLLVNKAITLANDDSNLDAENKNAAKISAVAGDRYEVTLDGRTFEKDGDWNTLCLPFGVSLDQIAAWTSDNVVIKELDVTTSNLTNGTLTLNFKDATSIEAGKPYIVKWGTKETANTSVPISNPVVKGVTINADAFTKAVFNGGRFVGTYSPITIAKDDKYRLFLGSSNMLCRPSDDMTLGSFRAYLMIGFGHSGDVNGDGETNSADLTALTNYLLGKGDEPPAADVDGDKKVDIADISALISILTNPQSVTRIVSNVEGLSLGYGDGGR